jgi:hypothetical protein
LCQIGIELTEQRVAVGQADVAPHFRRGAGDAGEVAEAAGRVLEQQVGMRLVGDVVDQRIGQQVRQVADRGEHLVVLARREVWMMAPHARQAAATVSTLACGFSGSGVSTAFLPR